MKKPIRISLSSLTACSLLFTLVACESKGPAKGSQEGASTPTEDVGAPTYSPYDQETALSTPQCKLSPSLQLEAEASNLKQIFSKNDLPKDTQYKLQSISMYKLYEHSNHSFVISAKQKQDYKVQLDCNGVPVVTEKDSLKTWVDPDKVTHPVSAEYKSNILGGTVLPEIITTSDTNQTVTTREIYIAFENGKVIESRSKTNSAQSEDSNEDPNVPTARMEIAKDTYMTLRFYSASEDTIDLRVKTELPANANGKRTIEYIKAIYKKI